MENNRPSLPFGRTFRIGNFSVLKINRTLSKKQIAELRKESKIPAHMLRNVERAGIPVIKVSAISGIWSIEFSAPSTMFAFLDSRDLENETDNNGIHNLFVSWLADTSVMGDKQYWDAKVKLIQEFLGRQYRPDSDDDDKAVEELKIMSDAKDKILEAAEELNNKQ